ncbi:DUF4245 family protein [Microbacterium sediminis]|uniref:Uncharacterized protein n=1 Tax=Microbacterium sediminis TaxID=904291 RepID=A0A1B9NFW2_9MICO|nr:DUF4245 family protein [Microbacterium sediminis]OCG75495.1 hypothetical protein A7J15_00030 [Microbacterium sediminis]QBR73891.1 DUF4245 family protein [Microbacterium sediminis]
MAEHPVQTAEEIAEQKAARSAAYRQSQTFRNLVVALLASLVVVAVIFFAVPRGTPAPRPRIDVSEVAQRVAESYQRDVIVPEIPDSWGVNVAEVTAGAPSVWQVVYTPDETSFLDLAQAFDGDETWAAQQLGGAAPTGSATIDGIGWAVYEIADPDAHGNVSYALGTQAGSDHVLLYGSASPETTAELAEMVADQVRALQEEAE